MGVRGPVGGGYHRAPQPQRSPHSRPSALIAAACAPARAQNAPAERVRAHTCAGARVSVWAGGCTRVCAAERAGFEAAGAAGTGTVGEHRRRRLRPRRRAERSVRCGDDAHTHTRTRKQAHAWALAGVMLCVGAAGVFIGAAGVFIGTSPICSPRRRARRGRRSACGTRSTRCARARRAHAGPRTSAGASVQLLDAMLEVVPPQFRLGAATRSGPRSC